MVPWTAIWGKSQKTTTNNKLETTLSIIKAELFLGEKASFGGGGLEVLIQPRSLHKSFRCRESNWHFSQVGSRNHVRFCQVGPWSLCGQSVCFCLYCSPFLSFCTHTHARCPVYLQCDLFYGLLAAQWKSSINWAMQWNISQISIQLCGLSTIHNNMMHLVQSVNHHGAADLCTYGLIYQPC